MKERLGFSELIDKLNKNPAPLNECMFDLNMGPEYIQKVVVWTEQERLTLINQLQKSGVYEMNGRPLEDVIVCSKTLNPSLIDNYDSAELKQGEEDVFEYI